MASLVTTTVAGTLAVKLDAGLTVERTSVDSRFRMFNTGGEWILASTFGSTGAYDPIKFQTSDVTRLTIAANGAATFSSTVTTTGLKSTDWIEVRNDAAEYYLTNAANTQYWRQRISVNSTAYDYIIDHYNGSSTITPLIISAAGAATFSSTITAKGGTFMDTAHTILDVKGNPGWTNAYAMLRLTGEGNQNTYIRHTKQLTFDTGSATTATLTTGGNFHVYGTLSSSAGLTATTGSFSGAVSAPSLRAGLIASGLITGDYSDYSVPDESAADTTRYGWTSYGNNTVAVTSGQIVITRVDSSLGAYRYFRSASPYHLTSDLIVDEYYTVTIKLKHSGASTPSVRVFDGAAYLSGFATLTTSLATYTTTFQAKHATDAFIVFYDLSNNDTITVDDLTLNGAATFGNLEATGAATFSGSANGVGVTLSDGWLELYNANVLQLYSTPTTAGANYETFALDKPDAGNARLRVYKSGTGTYRGMEFQTGGSARLTISAAGAATFSGALTVSGTATFSDDLYLGVNENIHWGGNYSFITGSGANNTGYLKFYTSDTLRLTIAGDGAATFAAGLNATGDVVITGKYLSSVDGERLQIGSTANGRGAVVGSKVYLPGGTTSNLDYSAYWAYDAYFDNSTRTWKSMRTTLGRKWKMEAGYHIAQMKFSFSSASDPISWSDLLILDNTGAIQFNSYGSGTHTGTSAYKLSVDSSGNIIETSIGAGAVDGSGTAGYISKWTDSDTIGNSIIYASATSVGISSVAFNSPAGTLHTQAVGTNITYLDTYSTTNGTGSMLNFRKSDNNTAGTKTQTDSGDSLGTIGFYGVHSESDWGLGAGINVSQEGASGASYVPAHMAFATCTASAYVEHMRITSAGLVGIGTNAPSAKLTILENTASDKTIILANNTAANARYSSIVSQHSATDHSFESSIRFIKERTGVNSGSSIGFLTELDAAAKSLDYRLYIQNGNVGIGTTEPNAKLEVVGTIRMGTGSYMLGEATSGIRLNNSADTLNLIVARNDGDVHMPGRLAIGGTTHVAGKWLTVIGPSSFSDSIVGTSATFTGAITGLSLATSAATGVVATAAGGGWYPAFHSKNTNADSAPSYITLEKISASPANGDYIGGIVMRGRTSTAAHKSYVEQWCRAMVVTNGSESSRWNCGTWGAGTEYPNTLVCDAGNVGIGTASPGSPLHLSATKDGGWLSQFYNAGAGGDANGLLLQSGTSGNEYIFKAVDKAGTTIGLAVRADGDVGIGTSSPSESLEVYGGNITADSLKNTTVWERINSYSLFCYVPKGAHHYQVSSTATGAIRITLPPIHDAMVSFWVDVYDYGSNTSFTAYITGYPFVTGGSPTWGNTSALILGSIANRDFTVRFGDNNLTGASTKYYVYIGETDTVWSYPQIRVRDVNCGFHVSTSEWEGNEAGWDVDFATSFANVAQTRTGNFPMASGSQLAAYLPLAGGTMTGTLTGTLATFSGNVGIGIADPGTYELNVNGEIYSSGTVTIANNKYYAGLNTSGAMYALLKLNASNQMEIGATNMAAAGYPARVLAKYITFEPAGNLGAPVETMRVTNGSFNGVGSVGIGTTAPDRKFHVVGTDEVARFTGTDANPPTIEFENSTGVQAKIGLKSGHDFIIDTAGEDIFMGAAANEFTIKADGKVGIGDTTPTDGKLVISSSSTDLNALYVTQGSASGSAVDFKGAYISCTGSMENYRDKFGIDVYCLTNNWSHDEIFGVNVLAEKSSSGNNNVYGVKSIARCSSTYGQGGTKNFYGLYGKVEETGSETITTAYSVYAASPTGSVTNAWGFYQGGDAKNQFGGSVGIGADPGSFMLNVNGTSQLNGLVSVNQVGIKIYNGWGGISTTLGGGSLFMGFNVKGASDGNKIEASNTHSGGAGWAYMRCTGYTNGISFHTKAGNTTAGEDAVTNERMRIDGNGNVGIGIAAPGYKTQIVSPSLTWGTSITDASAALSVVKGYQDGANDSDVNVARFASVRASYGATADWAGHISLFTNAGVTGGQEGTERARITWDGNSKLYFGRSTSKVLTVQTSGGDYVGIGTNAPVSKLHVVGSGTWNHTPGQNTTSDLVITSSEMSDNNAHSILQLVSVRQSLSTGSGATGYLGFTTMDDSNAQGVRDAGRIAIVNEFGSSRNSATALSFWTNAGGTDTTAPTEKMRIQSDGNVGIGTTSPGYLLDVRGNTWVQGSLETSGQLKAGTSLAIGSSGSGGYTFPATDGTNGYVLKTNGSGTVAWAADSGGGGTVTSVATSGAITGGTITTTGTITHSTSPGYKHVPTGGSSKQYLKYSSSGTAVWSTLAWEDLPDISTLTALP